VISGRVVANQGPFVSIALLDAGGNEQLLGALVDTGFTHWLTLPRSVIAAMGLGYIEDTVSVLADGTLRALPSYHATVIWDGQPREVFVNELESEPLIGMRLLHGFRFTMDTIEGGVVLIERL
jgi:clan AA aspartic protease